MCFECRYSDYHALIESVSAPSINFYLVEFRTLLTHVLSVIYTIVGFTPHVPFGLADIILEILC